jgi:hypothetical protein
VGAATPTSQPPRNEDGADPPVTTNQAALVITAADLRIPLSDVVPNAQVALAERQIREAAVPQDWSIAVRWVKVDDGHGHQKVIFWART